MGDVTTARQRGALPLPAPRQRGLRHLDRACGGTYGPGGELWRQHPELAQYALTRYEIWNEPNLGKFWACKPNAAAYVELARAATDAIHDIDPSATIITAGAPDKHGGKYLRKAFKAGAGKVFDGLALHSYKKSADDVLAEIRKARDMLADLDAKKWKVYVTEFGWATGGPPGEHTVNESKQGRLIKNTYVKLAEQRKKLKIASVDYYAWRDVPPPTDFGGGPDYWGLHTGLLRLDGTPKPALSQVLKASSAID